MVPGIRSVVRTWLFVLLAFTGAIAAASPDGVQACQVNEKACEAACRQRYPLVGYQGSCLQGCRVASQRCSVSQATLLSGDEIRAQAKIRAETLKTYEGPPRFSIGRPDTPGAVEAAARFAEDLNDLAEGVAFDSIDSIESMSLMMGGYGGRQCFYQYQLDGKPVKLSAGVFWRERRPELSKRYLAALAKKDADRRESWMPRYWDVAIERCPPSYGEAMAIARGETKAPSFKAQVEAGAREALSNGLRFPSVYMARDEYGSAAQRLKHRIVPAAAFGGPDADKLLSDLRMRADRVVIPPAVKLDWQALGSTGQELRRCVYNLDTESRMGGMAVYFWDRRAPARIGPALVEFLSRDDGNPIIDVAVDDCPLTAGFVFALAQGPKSKRGETGLAIAEFARINAHEMKRPPCERDKGIYAQAQSRSAGEPDTRQMCQAFGGPLEATAQGIENLYGDSAKAVGSAAGQRTGEQVGNVLKLAEAIFPLGVPRMIDFLKVSCKEEQKGTAYRCEFMTTIDYDWKRRSFKNLDAERTTESVIKGSSSKREGLFKRQGGVWTFVAPPRSARGGGGGSPQTGESTDDFQRRIDREWKDSSDRALAEREAEIQREIARDRERMQDQFDWNKDHCGHEFKSCGN